MNHLSSLQKALISGNGSLLLAETQKCLDEAMDPHEILGDGLIPGMEIVGEKFKNEELYVPEVIKIATIFKQSVEILKPLIVEGKIKHIGTVLIGTVEGDMHDVGKNIVVLMLEANGFEVVDLGVNVPEREFIEKARQHNADIIGMSALLTTTMPNIDNVIKSIREQGLEGKFKTIIGGAPINQSFANEVGADAYGHDAIDAVDKIKALLR